MSVSASSYHIISSVSGPGSFSAVSSFTFRQSKEGLIEALRSIKNPFVAKAITQKFKDLSGSTRNLTEEFASSSVFENLHLPPELKLLIERLSHEASEYCRGGEGPNEVVRRMRSVRSAFREIGEVVNTTPMWDDLAILLQQPEIQALSSCSLNLVMGSIEGKDHLVEVVSILETILGPDAFNRFCRRIEENGDDLRTLVDEIRRNKPLQQVITDIFSHWDENEAYFKSKTLKLNHSNINMQEPVVACHKTEEAWHFQFDDSDNTKIQVRKDRFVSIHQTHSYRLAHCLTGSPIPQGQQVSVEIEGKELSELSGGSYILNVIQDEGGTNQLKVCLSSLAELGLQHEFLCTKRPERGDLVEVNLKQGDRESKIPIDLFYQIRLKVEINLKIYLDDPARQFTFDEAAPGNSERVKLFQMRTIEKEMAGLQKQLLSNSTLLDQLLDEYFNSQCQTTNLQLIPDVWRKQLMDISYRYSQYLNLDRDFSTLVIQLMLAANYARFVPGRQSMQVRCMMELLRESQKYTRQLKDKDITLFIGNTGAGKSTIVAYLLGARLKPKENLGGEPCFVVSENKERYPIIGQGLGTSQTVFAQGFPIEEESSTVLCDPPGFNDTRGEEHILCANLTLDQAVKQARSIRAIVLTIPVQAFQVDRGGPVIALVERVRERFPNILQPQDTHKVPQYVVLTKSGQVQSEVVDAIENGIRFKVLHYEVEQEILREVGKESPNMFRIHDLERQKGIWQAFLNLSGKNRIDMPDLQNRRRRKMLLEKYIDPTERMNADNYVSAIDAPTMKKHCGEIFELSASYWRSMIFEKYLDMLPEAIDRHGANVKRTRGEIKQLEEELDSVVSEIKTLSQRRKELEQISAVKKTLIQEVQDQLTLLKRGWLNDLQVNIQRSSERFVYLKEASHRLDHEIARLCQAVEGYQEKIGVNKREIEELSQYPVKITLYSEDFRGKKIEMLDTRRDKEYREFAIENRYRVVQQRQTGLLESIFPFFPFLFKNKESQEGGYLRAESVGDYYEIEDHCTVHKTRALVTYGYTFSWQGSATKRPWMEIFHMAPGYEQNSGRIQVLNDEISAYEEKVISTNTEIARLRAEISDYQHESELVKDAIGCEETKIQDLNMQIQQDQEVLIRNMIANHIRAVAEKEQRKNWLSEKLEKLNQELNEIQSLSSVVEKEKRHLAVLIHAEWESAKVLREFSEMMIPGGGEGEAIIQKTSLIECQKFVQFYDEKIMEIQETVWKELNLAG